MSFPFRVSLAGLLCASLAGCNPQPPVPDASRRDSGTRDAAMDTSRPDVSTADNCEGLGNREGRCTAAGAPQICIGGALVERTCDPGYECGVEARRASCTCDLATDELCPAGCPEDPDCQGCTPDCEGRDCGTDGCGGDCGECGDGTLCGEGGICAIVEGVCNHSCEYSDDGECDDGGEDSDYDVCAYGSDCLDCGPRPELSIDCRLNYNDDCPDDMRCECGGRAGDCLCIRGERGTEPLGSECTTQTECATGLCVNDRCSRPCDVGEPCAGDVPRCHPILGVCVEGECEPFCEGRECGDDGCGGSCGSCSSGECVAGSCESSATGHVCPGRDDCSAGEACCISPESAGCLEQGSTRATACREAAEETGSYGYLGCHQNSDCAGDNVCCGNAKVSFCAPDCTNDAPIICNTSAPVCGGTSFLRCCPIAEPVWFEGEYRLGRCEVVLSGESCPTS